ncbi:hypothetical protein CP532_0853 [Ophiocordyceps camponoti-leonardi (nom. inval.)]|nr:hypothetical protein CP532_0853 [Ophiocordyceps camponoti-leonardi (nom. inval.)]
MYLSTFLSLFLAIGTLAGSTTKTLSPNARVVATAFNALHVRVIAIKVAIEALNGKNSKPVDDAWAAFFATIEDQTKKVQKIGTLTLDDIDSVLDGVALFTNDMEATIEHRPATMARVTSVIQANGFCGKFYEAARTSSEKKDRFVAALMGKIPQEIMFPVTQYRRQWDTLLNKMQWRYAPGNCTNAV